jgi:iron(III) transport system substrate-binding protein
MHVSRSSWRTTALLASLTLSLAACSAAPAATQKPPTAAPATAVAATPIPATPVPPTAAPVTAAPVTAAPVTPVPATPVPATPEPPSADAVCAAGKAEGGFSYVASFDPENIAKIYAPFETKYGIALTYQQLFPEQAVQRVVTEHDAGHANTVDIVYGELSVLATLLSRGLAAEDVDWAALGVPASLITESSVVRVARGGVGLAFNTEQSTADQLPNTWDELIDAKWAGGKVVIDPRGLPFSTLGLSWGEERMLAYVTSLKETVQPAIVPGTTAGLQAIASGEAQVSTSARDIEVAEQQSQGVPLEIKYLDVVPTLSNYQLVLKDAPHPNAAQCFVTWLASPEGAAMVKQVEFKGNDDRPAGAPASAEVIATNTVADARQEAAFRSLIAPIWAGE